jgi:hypothetical protein
MNFPNATFIVCVDENFIPYLKLLKSNLNKSGVRYELFILSLLDFDFDFSDLQPKKVWKKSNIINDAFAVNEMLSEVSTENVLIIQEPFLCSENWCKEAVDTKKSILTLGVLIVPYVEHIENLYQTHTLNKNFDIMDIYALHRNKYCGVYLLSLDTITALGGFNTNLGLKYGILEYCTRAIKMGLVNYATLKTLISLTPKEEIVFYTETPEQIQVPLKTFSPVEEMAYHELDNLLHSCKIEAEKFMTEFMGVFGFRTMCLNQQNIQTIHSYCIRFNLSFEIKSGFLSPEQKLNKNVWIIFKTKS